MTERHPTRRQADHEVIDRLTAELLPALIIRLAATGLGELEVREGDWRIRLRAPIRDDGAQPMGRRAAAAHAAGPASGRHVGGAAGHHPSAAGPHWIGREARPGPPPVAEAQVRLAAVGPGLGESDRETSLEDRLLVYDRLRITVTSPAVGIFVPQPGLAAGMPVRGGDRIAAVDVLGLPQEVVAPADGILGISLVAAGEAVEYGQELMRIEPVEAIDGSHPLAVGVADVLLDGGV